MEGFQKVTNASDLPEGRMMVVEVGSESILLANVSGEFYAIAEACSHFGGPLADGWLNGDEVECPWHGSRFCLKTGEVVKQPATEPVARYSVRIEGDDVYVGPAE